MLIIHLIFLFFCGKLADIVSPRKKYSEIVQIAVAQSDDREVSTRQCVREREREREKFKEKQKRKTEFRIRDR